MLSLDLPLLGAYFPTKLHWYFKPRGEITSWFAPTDVQNSHFPEGAGLMVSGSPAFIDGILSDLGLTCHVIALVLFRLHGSTVRSMHKDCVTTKEVLNWHDLHIVSFLDSDNRGATDTCYMLGFGSDLVSDILPGSMKGLPWTLRHCLEGTALVSSPLRQGSLDRLFRRPRPPPGRSYGTSMWSWARDSFRAPGRCPRCTAPPTFPTAVCLATALSFQAVASSSATT